MHLASRGVGKALGDLVAAAKWAIAEFASGLVPVEPGVSDVFFLP